MKDTKIYFKKMKLKDPVLLVGLPGIGNVGALVAEHLKNELKAKKFATLYSPHFPFQILMMKNGRFRLVNNRFYLYKNAKGKNDIVILLGDSQSVSPEGQYEVNERIVEFFKQQLGGKQIYTIGGYSIGNQYVKSPRVFGIATDPTTWRTLRKHGVESISLAGTPVYGSAGMIVAFSKKHRISAACIMGETGMLDVDANSAKAVLQVLNKLLGLNVSLENMEKLKAETERMLRDMEESAKNMNPADKPKDTQSYIR